MDDAKLNAALDRFTVPPPPTDLAARISMAAQNRAAAPVWRRRLTRRQWQRSRNIFVGGAATLLLSATAAASGWFGGQKVQIPVISTLVAKANDIIAPAPHKPEQKVAEKPKSKPPTKALAEPKETTEALVVPPLPPPEAIIGSPAEKRAQAANRVSENMTRRLDEIDARRAAKGLPAVTAERRALLDALKSAQTDEERKTALRAIREDNARRMAKQMEKRGQQANDPANEEIRDRIRERIRERRLQRLREAQNAPPVDPAPPQAEAPMPVPATPVE